VIIMAYQALEEQEILRRVYDNSLKALKVTGV
jgi:hypothetical protein